ncbi:MAG: peptidoglycan-binding protein [Candidatus Omnitrophota bacterium]|jgi:peptidoglycan hydrolase-like protein with peptidoglycan-binding domain
MRGRVYLYILAGFVTLCLCGAVFYRTNGLSAQKKAFIEEKQVIGAVDSYNLFVENIQFLLRGASFEPGSENGILDTKTRKAIKRFQSKHGLWQSGIVDLDTWHALELEQEKLRSHVVTDIVTPPLDAGLENEKNEPAFTVTVDMEAENNKLAISGNRNKRIQIALRKAGFYQGDIDGKIGPKSKAAARMFQSAKGLKADGIIGDKTMAELEKYLN